MHALHDCTEPHNGGCWTFKQLESDLESTERPATGSSLFRTRAGKSKVSNLVIYSVHPQKRLYSPELKCCVFGHDKKGLEFFPTQKTPEDKAV